MDIKIQTKSETFLIYIENLTIHDLKCKLKRLQIELKDIVIYFYDNDDDKIVIIDDKDVEYAFQQQKIKFRNRIKFYIYYKLKQHNTWIPIQDQKVQIISDESESIRNSSDNLNREDKLKLVIENYIDILLREQYEI